jgi:membrane protein
MSLPTAIRQRIERLLTQPGQELGRVARFVRFQIQLWRFCARQLWEDNVTAMSASLSFRTIFALVPAIALAFLVLKSVGVLEDGKAGLSDLLEASGLAEISVVRETDPIGTPAGDTDPTGPRIINVAKEIESLVERVESKLTVERLGPIGVVLLIWTALTLLTAMERSLNRIFNAPRNRSLLRSMPLYWSLLTLGPVVLMAADYAGDRIVGRFGDAAGVAWLLAALGWAGPVLVGMLVVSALYKLLPNTRVRFRSAIGGAVIAVPLWLIAKWAFALYVRKFVATGNLYGALGLLPLFLMWLNLSWLIFLFGAEIAHTAVNLGRLELTERAKRVMLGPIDLLAAAVAVARPYLKGQGPASVDEVASQLQLPGESTERLLDRLNSVGLICPVEGEAAGTYVPARAAARTPILQILEIQSLNQPETERRYTPEIRDAIDLVRQQAHNTLGSLTLADLLDKE